MSNDSHICTNNKIVIDKIEILPFQSILKQPSKNTIQISINEDTNIWIYNNNLSSVQKRITLKQLKFLTKLFDFFLNYQNSKNQNPKFIASKSYLPVEVSEYLLNCSELTNLMSKSSPLNLVKKVIEKVTLNFSDCFTVSFFSLFNFKEYQEYNKIQHYLANYKQINREILNLFKVLMKKEIVIISNNLVGDTIINTIIPNQKTQRNIKVIHSNSYLIPLQKINIFDLLMVYYVSSSFEIKDNIVVGRISKRKLSSLSNAKILQEIESVLKRLKVSSKNVKQH
ncbi:MAG: hypothetical protein N2712_02145 [Brevinematales bacterium]|nr:hypothetical protein [Brevinematales bacterium]